MALDPKTHQQRLQAQIKACHSCGRTYMKRFNPSDFCNSRCEEWLRNGNSSYSEQMKHLQQIKNCEVKWDYDFLFNTNKN